MRMAPSIIDKQSPRREAEQNTHHGLETANQNERSQPESRAVEFVFTLFSQAFEYRHLRNFLTYSAMAGII